MVLLDYNQPIGRITFLLETLGVHLLPCIRSLWKPHALHSSRPTCLQRRQSHHSNLLSSSGLPLLLRHTFLPLSLMNTPVITVESLDNPGWSPISKSTEMAASVSFATRGVPLPCNIILVWPEVLRIRVWTPLLCLISRNAGLNLVDCRDAQRQGGMCVLERAFWCQDRGPRWGSPPPSGQMCLPGHGDVSVCLQQQISLLLLLYSISGV